MAKSEENEGERFELCHDFQKHCTHSISSPGYSWKIYEGPATLLKSGEATNNRIVTAINF